ncbi:MAG: hypothetical protein J6S95_00635 [Lachnospiraceae bacterium]|nr:hypothetical protein [Lachnospiraceae bacterium]
MKTKNPIIENTAAFLLLAVTIFIIAFTHKTVPYMLDDLWYSTNLKTGEPLKSISDIWESQVWHYLNWGGRSMTHGILQFTFLCGEVINNVLNVVFTLLLSTVIIITATDIADVKLSITGWAFDLSIVMGMLHGLNANWMMSMYWQSGSANYLYISVFVLFFAYCYLREFSDGDVKPFSGITVWIVPLSVLAGWSNENMGPTVWLLSLFTIVYRKKKDLSVKLWMILGCVFSFLGSLACIIAPGNFKRSAEVDAGKGFLWKAFLRVYSESRGIFDFLYPAAILALILLIMYYPLLKKKVDIKTILLLVMAALSWGAMVLSPHYPDRATYGTLVFFIVVIISLVLRLIKEKEELRPWLNGALLFVYVRGMFWLCEYLAAFYHVIE